MFLFLGKHFYFCKCINSKPKSEISYEVNKIALFNIQTIKPIDSKSERTIIKSFVIQKVKPLEDLLF